ncbi:MAG: hypothetical protein JXB07_20920 [Anaerolineae bacterium]|nr:hypothetical protein [Anaerolineae bacterium]
MSALKTRLLLIAMIALVPALIAIVLFAHPFILQPQAMGVDQLWHMKYKGEELEGKPVVIQGDTVFDSHADYHFNLFLVDTLASTDEREPMSAFWFGICIADLKCEDKGTVVVCQPFDPSQADAFAFTGTIHFAPAGMRPIMELTDIDFEQSRQLIDGEWLPIPLGEFEVPVD